MDANLKQVVEKRIQRTMEALEKNNMQAFYAQTAQDAVKIAAGLVQKDDTVTAGGSMTLIESGMTEMLKSGACNFVDRDAPENSPERRQEIMRLAFSADVYFTSTNALTEQGELYNIDGNGNRVAAMMYGPKSVVVVAGYNKIVEDIKAAEERLRAVASPANAIRLNCNTPCAKIGHCMDCKSDRRICRDYVRMGAQGQKNRIKIILVGEELGY